MLFFITGANGVGKTACLPILKRLLPDFSVHDFADLGVAPSPDARWRQETTEQWVHTYLGKHQPQSRHLVVSGEAVFGEILACPSITQIDAFHACLLACLLDCDDMTRVDRLRARGTYGPNMQILCWAAFLRVHSVDPSWCPEVLQMNQPSIMHWEQWMKHQRCDPAWHQEIIDTSRLSLEQVAEKIAEWIQSKIRT